MVELLEIEKHNICEKVKRELKNEFPWLTINVYFSNYFLDELVIDVNADLDLKLYCLINKTSMPIDELISLNALRIKNAIAADYYDDNGIVYSERDLLIAINMAKYAEKRKKLDSQQHEYTQNKPN